MNQVYIVSVDSVVESCVVCDTIEAAEAQLKEIANHMLDLAGGLKITPRWVRTLADVQEVSDD